MGSDNGNEGRAVLLGIVVLVVTLFGVLAKYDKLDDVGRIVGNLLN